MTLPSALTRFETDLFVPSYQPMSSGNWTLRVGGHALIQGYWSPASLVSDFPVLMRGKETWMSITPLELESQEIGIRLAHGHVVILGLGLGWAAAATAMLPEVTRVTVVERDPDVIALHDELDIFAQLPPEARAKVHIAHCDALEYRPDVPVDLLMPDIWLWLVSDGRVDEVRRMQANMDARTIYFWGQELELARHARAAGREFDADGIAAVIADWDLPIIGTDWPDYPALVRQVSDRWMGDRWL